MLEALDLWILQAFSSLHHPILDAAMPQLTKLGNAGIFWILLACVLLCFPKTRRCGGCMAVCLLLLFLLGNCMLKPLIARPRPYILQPDLTLLIPPPTDASFPSGHTYSSISSAWILYRFYPKWGVGAMLLAVLIAVSRLYLQVHFFTDILGGAILGILCAAVACRICRRSRQPES